MTDFSEVVEKVVLKDVYWDLLKEFVKEIMTVE